MLGTAGSALRAIALCAAAVHVFGQAAPQTTLPAPPLQVRLDVPLDNKRAVAGAPVFAAALSAWQGAGCSLDKGGVVSGHVVEAAQKKGRTTEARLMVLFDKADCNGGHGVPVQLLLYAVAAPLEQPSMMYEDPALYGDVFNHSTASARSTGPSRPITERITTDVREGTARGALTGPMRAGQVVGGNHVEMEVGSGPEGASLLHSVKDNFRIETGATLVLVVPLHPESLAASGAMPAAVSAVTPPQPAASASAPVAAANEADACGTNCEDASTPVAGTEAEQEGAVREASATLSLGQIGYRHQLSGDGQLRPPDDAALSLRERAAADLRSAPIAGALRRVVAREDAPGRARRPAGRGHEAHGAGGGLAGR
ncbi:MAG TPA: hypothetical protein VGC07_03490 [Granulicella sp.]